MDMFAIDIEKQRTLQFSGNQEILLKTIASLTGEQMHSQLFKNIATERYLSALRAGGIDNAEMTKFVFQLDQYFINSKLVKDAALEGFYLQVERGHLDVAKKIKDVMKFGDDIAPLPESLPTSDVAKKEESESTEPAH